MSEILCPECEAQLESEDPCSCGLDPSLLFRLDKRAKELAGAAATEASHGHWQPAYELAALSLHLRQQGNDLASFVLLTAALSGANGRVRSVFKPESSRLPASLQPHIEPVVAAVTARRTLALEGPSETSAAKPQIGNGAQLRAAPLEQPPRLSRARLLVPSAVGVIAALVTFLGLWAIKGTDQTPPQPVTQPEVVDSPLPANSHQQDLDQMQSELSRLQESERHNSLKRQFLAALLAGEWEKVAETAHTLGPEKVEELLESAGTEGLARSAYLAGLRQSRMQNYEGAATLFTLALAQSDPEAYFADDALYYQARAYDRSSQSETAAHTYQDLLSGYPDSPYAPEARRFLEALTDSSQLRGSS